MLIGHRVRWAHTGAIQEGGFDHACECVRHAVLRSRAALRPQQSSFDGGRRRSGATGEVPARKWMNFYTQVLAKYATAGDPPDYRETTTRFRLSLPHPSAPVIETGDQSTTGESFVPRNVYSTMPPPVNEIGALPCLPLCRGGGQSPDAPSTRTRGTVCRKPTVSARRPIVPGARHAPPTGRKAQVRLCAMTTAAVDSANVPEGHDHGPAHNV